MFHMIESALIHGLIYRVLWAAMRSLGLHGVIVWAIVGILSLALAHFMLRRLFYRPRWRRRW
jgi:hypothetical protein